MSLLLCAPHVLAATPGGLRHLPPTIGDVARPGHLHGLRAPLRGVAVACARVARLTRVAAAAWMGRGAVAAMAGERDGGHAGGHGDDLRANGARLRALRVEARLSQRALGGRIGYSHVTIGEWERGVARVPHDALALVMDALDAELALLREWRGFLRGMGVAERRLRTPRPPGP